jgi:hypothetical protein
MNEHLSGDDGEVYVKTTREALGNFPYELTKSPRREGSPIMHIDLTIGLDAATALPFVHNQATLVLRVTDGRCVEFHVRRAGMLGNNDVEVTAVSDLLPEEQL